MPVPYDVPPGSIDRRNAFFEGGSTVHLRSDSAAGVRFLASVREGRGLKPSARAAGVGKETGYRWLREAFLALREQGFNASDAQAELGYCTPLAAVWEQTRADGGGGRHHLALALDVEEIFWTRYLGGDDLDSARRAAGVARSTAYRWLQRRYMLMREKDIPGRRIASELRLPSARAAAWEAERRRSNDLARRDLFNAERRAVRESARHVELLLQPRHHSKAEQRERRYWELMRQGMTNTAACKLLGVSRRTGGLIRQRHRHQTAALIATQPSAGRYLSLPERLQIADLLTLGLSMRSVAAELGRSPSTVKRELDRHRDPQGRYLPRGADQRAQLARRRPRAHKLVANHPLRLVVQRKLNRCWSPDEISGWLGLTHPGDRSMQLCPETIYRALLVPGGQGLHKRYCGRLRTGRRIRKSRWLTRSGHGAVVRNMTMIDQRPPEVETKQQAGHWEGDLIVGIGSASAMMTLRERKTHYGIIVNLPVDHTTSSVNAAATAAFATMPAHMRRTLTWDQGVEMARHQDLADATGIKIYFAERSSPWQRGANENFNGLARQYFPKGTDLSVHTFVRVEAVMRELNTRPRKTLGYQTPASRFRAETRSVKTGNSR
jgi:IS30 family transposase